MLISDGKINPRLIGEQQFSIREKGADQALFSALSLKPITAKLKLI